MGVLTRSGWFRFSGATLCFMLLVPAVAKADPIVLTGGAVDVSSGGAVNLHLVGNDFTFDGGTDIFSGVFAPLDCVAFECGVGTTVSLAAGWVGNDLPGTATFRGATFTRVGGLDELAAQMQIDLAGTFVVPPGGGLVRAPFTVTGQFLFPSGPLGPDFEFRSVSLVGRGVASVWLSELEGDPRFFFAPRVRYDLERSVPTPEPGSMGLLLCGLAWAASNGRRLLRG